MEKRSSNSPQNNSVLKVLIPSVVVISLLVAVTFVGAIIVVIRAYRLRKRRISVIDVEAAAAADSLFSHGRDLRDPRLPHPPQRTLRQSSIEQRKDGQRWRNWWPPSPQIGELPTANTPSRRKRDEENMIDDWDITGRKREVGPSIAPILRSPDTVEMIEAAEGSLRKLELLTGSKVVPSSRKPTNIPYALHSKPTQDESSEKASADALRPSSSDTSVNASSLSHLINPLTAPPANPVLNSSNIAELKGISQDGPTAPKRVSFILSKNITHHNATQFSSMKQQHRSSFGYQSSLRLPSITRSATHSSSTPSEKLYPGPPPLNHERLNVSKDELLKSWNGRSVLELDSTSPSESASDYQATTGPSPRPPLQEAAQLDMSSLRTLTRPRSLQLPLLHDRLSDQGLYSIPATSAFSRFGGDNGGLPSDISISDVSNISMYDPTTGHPPEFPLSSTPFVVSPVSAPTSPVPRGPAYSYPSSRRPGSVSDIGAAYLGPTRTYSSGTRSVADTVLTENTANSLTTNMTEKELQMEMERIRERAKRASTERKVKRLAMEMLEAEEKQHGESKWQTRR